MTPRLLQLLAVRLAPYKSRLRSVAAVCLPAGVLIFGLAGSSSDPAPIMFVPGWTLASVGMLSLGLLFISYVRWPLLAYTGKGFLPALRHFSMRLYWGYFAVWMTLWVIGAVLIGLAGVSILVIQQSLPA